MFFLMYAYPRGISVANAWRMRKKKYRTKLEKLQTTATDANQEFYATKNTNVVLQVTLVVFFIKLERVEEASSTRFI